jgi:hypothetical protein
LAFDVGAFSKMVSRPVRYPLRKRAAVMAILKRILRTGALTERGDFAGCGIWLRSADRIGSVEGAGSQLERKLG